MIDYTSDRKCPRCAGPMPGHPGALSRFDNMTEVCSGCGQNEALYQMFWGDVPNFEHIIIGTNAYKKETA